jgi:cyclopropane-fatty-acyl-phospholipid synthase
VTYTVDDRGLAFPEPLRWPDVFASPRGGLRAGLGGWLFHRAVRRLPVRVQTPDGANLGGGAVDAPLMVLRRPEAVLRRVSASGTIGFGEAYMAGDWETDDLVGVLTAFASNVGRLIPMPLQKARHAILSRMPNQERNTLHGAARNISRHYDLSNELFALFLDPTMTYSSAVFAAPDSGLEDAPDNPIAVGSDLRTAQHRKIDRLLDLAKVGVGTRVLEIGSGWGELALRAAARGATVHTVTISAEQAARVRERIDEHGVADRVRVELCDYRNVTGEYDAVVSVEMIEAVGLDHVQDYFEVLDQRLAPGGFVALQAITMPHDRMVVSRDTYTWMRKYIFPGGQILSVAAIREAVEQHTALVFDDDAAFGLHYAETLRQWRETFLARHAEVAALGFDKVFRRMWEFYLAYSEAGFRAGYLDVHQFRLTKPASGLLGLDRAA